jgi:cysteine-rich repeat protein
MNAAAARRIACCAVAVCAALSCRQPDSVVVVSVTAAADVPAIDQLRAFMSNGSATSTRSFPEQRSTAPLAFAPATSFAVVVPRGRTGYFDIAIDGLSAGTVVANGAGRASLKVGGNAEVALTLAMGPSSCGNGTLDPGEQCDDGRRFSGDGCDFQCHIEGAGVTDAGASPGEVGTGGAGTVAGTGGQGVLVGTGGIPGTAGNGSGGTTSGGSGGSMSSSGGVTGSAGGGQGGAPMEGGSGASGGTAGAAGTGASGGTGAGGSGGRGGAPASGGTPGTGGAPATGGKSGAGGGGAAAGGVSGAAGREARGGAAGDPDLQVWYRFDDRTGTLAADASGMGRTATLVSVRPGSASFSPVAKIGSGAVDLVGTGMMGGGYVLLPGAVSALAPDAVTIACWVLLHTSSAEARLFDFGVDASTSMFLTPQHGGFLSLGGDVEFQISHGATSQQSIESTSALSPGIWHHVAVVLRSGSPYTGSLYIDGALAAMNTGMTLHPSDLGMTINNWLGRSTTSTSDPYLDALLDDFRIYSRALTDSEIAALYQSSR